MKTWSSTFRTFPTPPTLLFSVWAATLAASPARGVPVNVPHDDVTLNLGVLLQAGHYYEYRKTEPYYFDYSRFAIRDAEVAVTGTIFENVTYALRSQKFRYIREGYVGVEAGDGFSAAVGYMFVPFGVEATTYEGDLTCSSRTTSSEVIAPGRDYGLRLAYDVRRETWPYNMGATAGVFNGSTGSQQYGNPLLVAAARCYGTPFPGLETLRLGVSYYYYKTRRYEFRGSSTDSSHFLEEPRLGVDVGFSLAGVTFAAEYMQRFLNNYPVRVNERYWPLYVYKDTYYRGYFATLDYHRKLRWRYFQGIQPYVRYERWDPPVLERGDIPERRYTGGLALLFLGRNLMFRSDYTRIIEDSHATTNDRVASEFQVSF
jgi:hypothetical protein